MALKLKFDPKLDYQIDAINAIVDIFEGQTQEQAEFMKEFMKKPTELLEYQVIGNNIILDDETLLRNVRAIQDRNDLPRSTQLNGMNFSVEMETGTGKTYVYLRTIFDLNKKYGFKKFVIVVPSIAIKEGVKKSIEITRDHFRELYDRTPFDLYIYDSKNETDIRKFATANTIQILIINIDAFRRTLDSVDDELKANIIHRQRESYHGRKPIEYLQATHPIVIIDEPQSVDNTEKAKQAIETLNPLCTLRYSATHRDTYNLMYNLNPIKAYDLRLVKKVIVSSLTDEADASNAYVKLNKVDHSKGIKANLTILKKTRGGIKESKVTVKHSGEDLYTLSGEVDSYQEGYIVNTISAEPGNEYVEFRVGRLYLGQSFGGHKEELLKAQVQAAIQEHLDKELKLINKNLKVLSLFFIDRVHNYRDYDEKGNRIKGKFAIWFEEIFNELIKKPYYEPLLEKYYSDVEIDELHDGYFAQDKKTGQWKDSKESKGGLGGKTKADDTAYDLIMKDKEKLLSFDSSLRFIFSHSALREGWDNPNVFQICTLNETRSTIKKRQEIGRGLRLPVNQEGERIKDDQINRLTVVVNESYKEFIKTLQSEFEADGIRFGRVDEASFKKIFDFDKHQTLDIETSRRIFDTLQDRGYLDKEGKITDKFDPEDKDFKLNLGGELEKHSEETINILKSYTLSSRVVNKKRAGRVKLKKEWQLDDNFKELWSRIKQKTTYSLEYSTNDLIKNSVERITDLDKIEPIKIRVVKATTEITQGGIESEEVYVGEIEINYSSVKLPDALTYIDRKLDSKITRHAISEILIKSNRLDEFKSNPQKFMDEISESVKYELNDLIVKGVKYEKIAGEEYEMRLFEDGELKEFFSNFVELQNPEKSLYDKIIYDSETERKFAKALDNRTDIKLFIKLPNWFKIDTPVGFYNPDWAIVRQPPGEEEKLYLVKETKGSKNYEQLRTIESYKIKCGKRHFDTIDTGIKFGVATTPGEVV